jgi:hypothetical protein
MVPLDKPHRTGSYAEAAACVPKLVRRSTVASSAPIFARGEEP